MATNVEAVLATIRQLESGNNYTINTRGGSDACGAYQYVTSTWQVMLQRTINAGQLPGNTPRYSRACQAPKNVQDAVARYDVVSFLGSVRDDVSLVPIHWYYPAAIQSWPAMAGFVPPGNSISLGDYQRKWMQTYSVFANVPLSSLNEGNNPVGVNNNTGIQYSYAQLEQIWINAGGNPQNANIAAAVAMAESSGNPNAISASNDYGLWQINIVHGSQATLDVMNNARAAVAISNGGQDWGPWCTCWVDPNANCGHFLGPNPQPGSPAAKFIQSNIPPDPNVAVNGTAAQTQSSAITNPDNPAQELNSSGCNTLEWVLDPAYCTGKKAGSIAGGAASAGAEHIAGAAIDLIIGTILNPIISIVAGIMGMAAGAALMLVGIYMLTKDSTPVQAIKGIAETAAVSAVAPELAPVVGAEEAQKIHSKREMHQATKRAVGSKVSSKRQQQIQRRQALRSQAGRYRTYNPAAAGAPQGGA